MNKNTFVVGFMLFAIFFGAGNLIFPPKLGFESGVGFWPAILGFVTTGVGLPLLGILVATRYEGGYKKALEDIHPWISVLLLGAIYLTIGPFFAIPRTAATAFDMAVIPFIGSSDPVSLFAFTFVYFAITLWVSLNPTKMVDRIGAILTPVLLVAIIALVVRMASILISGEYNNTSAGMETPLIVGFIEGYQTMDVLASFAFSVVVMNAIRAKSDKNTSFIKQATVASVIAAIALAFIYIAIGWIGNNIPLSAETVADVASKGQNLGVFILNDATTQSFGELGRSLLGLIVTLACLTTAIGLVVATSSYFNSIFPAISYRNYAILFTLIGFGLANQGLNAVISKSVPVLLVLYPISMTAMLLLLVNLVMPLPKLAKGIPLVLVAIVSILSVMGAEVVAGLPFKAYSMEWLPVALFGCFIGLIIVKAQAQMKVKAH
ncbi:MULTISPECIES: branched-chain amino acid transport system II carrier protein [Pasteurella]|uniref:branched-chain amino acid transport system II carrier protein n=1 Tax=Pasteurella TaxID=745 RepID=UPI0002144745|nr:MULTISPECIES: branched-chain amino acid transport system II carrier protein [Pasteurella]EGP03240.1 branched-chain amino acid carrier protein [Pasteurella multocida subsp. multocida str. Anand1_goat]AMM82231.1 branched-chain amino acid ABC transporter substrate-binding protein [Pasteurella multocida subsp. multocida PMTB2.1]APW56953.1 branched-chain amino acid transport system II carrier protein [Pasteurella multocida]ATC20566.1 branched-chain amino acid transport system II carrier protein [